jgi:amidase
VPATFITSFRVSGSGQRVAVKDLIDMAGVPTTAGSRVLAEAAVPAERDAACLAGLRAAYQANRELLETCAARISPDVASRLDAGRRVSPATLAEAAQARDSWRAQLTALFDRFDLLVSPTLLILPPTLDDASQLLGARATMPVNLAGVPALALPVPAAGRLPASLQLISAWGTEEFLLAAGAAAEAAVRAGSGRESGRR